jgi:hypothetical protein
VRQLRAAEQRLALALALKTAEACPVATLATDLFESIGGLLVERERERERECKRAKRST